MQEQNVSYNSRISLVYSLLTLNVRALSDMHCPFMQEQRAFFPNRVEIQGTLELLHEHVAVRRKASSQRLASKSSNPLQHAS